MDSSRKTSATNTCTQADPRGPLRGRCGVTICADSRPLLLVLRRSRGTSPRSRATSHLRLRTTSSIRTSARASAACLHSCSPSASCPSPATPSGEQLFVLSPDALTSAGCPAFVRRHLSASPVTEIAPSSPPPQAAPHARAVRARPEVASLELGPPPPLRARPLAPHGGAARLGDRRQLPRQRPLVRELLRRGGVRVLPGHGGGGARFCSEGELGGVQGDAPGALQPGDPPGEWRSCSSGLFSL